MASLDQARPTKRIDERVVVIMGPTGSGKTTLTNCIAKRSKDHGVGHNVESYTTELELVEVKEPIHGYRVTLIDTPGFDDTTKSDAEVLAEIAEFLIATYKTGLQLDTILYLHPISHRRMTGSMLKNLRMFVSLCGIQSMPGVVIITTMWNDMANKEDGEKREKELEKKYWFDMIAKGCVVKRFDCTYSSALEILACTPRLVEGTLLTSEMVNEGKPLKATAAGYELANDIANTIKKQKAKNRALRKSSKKATNDKERSYLEGERVENDENIRNANKRLLLVKTTLFDRLFMSKPEASLVPRVGMLPQD